MIKYHDWIPQHLKPNTFKFYALYDNAEGIRILLEEDHEYYKVFIIDIENIITYRKTIRNSTLRVSSDIDQFMTEGSGFFSVENCEFIKWFHKESLEIHTDIENLMNYVIYTKDVIIEVISHDSPTCRIDDRFPEFFN